MLKRIFCVVLAILIPIALFPMSAFAAPADLYDTTGRDLVTIVTDLYGMYYNMTWTNVYSNDPGITQATTSAVDYVVSLYNDYASAASDPYTAAGLAAALVAAGAIAVIYDSVTGQGYVSLYLDQYISSLDGYWDYACSDMGLFRDEDGYFYWEKDQDNVVVDIPVATVGEFPLVPISSFSVSDISSSGLFVLSTSSRSYYVSSFSSDVFAYLYLVNDHYSISAFSPSSTSRINATNGSTFRYSPITSAVPGYDFFRATVDYSVSSDTVSFINPAVPVFTSLADAYSAFADRVARAFKIVAEPSVYLDQLAQQYDKILLPDVSAPDYSPQPVIIDTNVWWDDSWGTVAANPTPGVYYRVTDENIYNEAVPDILSQLISNDVQVDAPSQFAETPSDPSDPSSGSNEVNLPLLPVTLPSFDFSLSGIWYYVVQWVGSLGSFLGTLFTVWSTLPYAMVVPVYATAVVVIVFGVYKRFFM